MINRPDLKVRDEEKYAAYYCGVCTVMRHRYGHLSAVGLNYDCTFLAVLLSSLYEEPEKVYENHCPHHPATRRKRILTPSVKYAADMNFLLEYYNIEDDWIDEKKPAAGLFVLQFRKKARRVGKKYPRQTRALREYIEKLHRLEQRNDADVESAATLTGRAIAEIFVRKEDAWSENLRQMGFYLGKFIYWMDAYDDVEKDLRSGNYNPFKKLYCEGKLEENIRVWLKMMMGGCCRAFEALPVLQNEELLRNILYSGVWVKYMQISRARRERQDGAGKGSCRRPVSCCRRCGGCRQSS